MNIQIQIILGALAITAASVMITPKAASMKPKIVTFRRLAVGQGR
jgi:hypothetical protein